MGILAWILGIGAAGAGGWLLFGYMNQPVFPQPLEPEEEQRYITAWQAGDPEAREKLIEHNLRLVAHVVRKYEGCGENPEDLISIGSIGLIKAVNTYNSRQGFKLVTYAAKCIENEILMHIRHMKRRKQEISLSEPIGFDKDGNEVALEDVLPSMQDVFQEVETHLQQETVWAHLKKLTPQEQIVLILRYGLRDGVRETQRKIAEKLHISRSYVSRIEKRALHQVLGDIHRDRQALEERGEAEEENKK